VRPEYCNRYRLPVFSAAKLEGSLFSGDTLQYEVLVSAASLTHPPAEGE
jgi:hypothetical protein